MKSKIPLLFLAALSTLFLDGIAPADPAEEPPGGQPEDLLRLAIRSEEERSGDYDGVAKRWLEAVRKLEAEPPATELILRRLFEIRPHLAGKLKLIPLVEEAYKYNFHDGLYPTILRGFLADLYRREGNRKWIDLEKGDGYLRQWSVIGPFGLGGRSQFRRRFPPEYEIEKEKVYPGKKGPIRWRTPPRPEHANRLIVPARWIYPQEGVVYLLAELPLRDSGKTEKEAVLHIGGREPVSAWMNGRQVLKEDPHRHPEMRAIPVNFEEGLNRLLIKTLARTGSALWIRMTDLSGYPWKGQIDSSGPPETYELQEAPLRGAGHASPESKFRHGAARAWEEAVQQMGEDGESPEAQADHRIGLALLLSLRGNQEQAVAHAEKALELRPGDAAIQAHAGRIFLQASYLPKDHARNRARVAFQASIEKDPDYMPAYLPLAEFLSEDNENSRSAELLRTALSRVPEFLGARIQLLKLFQELEWEVEAKEAAAAVESLAPQSPAPALHRARWFLRRKNPPRALQEASSALEREQSNSVLHLIAEIALEAGDVARAESALQARLFLDPENPEALRDLGGFYRDRGDWDRAISIFKELDAQNPAHPAPVETIGRILEQAGRLEESKAYYDRALQREPGAIRLARHRDRLEAQAPLKEFWSSFDEDVEALLPQVSLPEGGAKASAIAVLDLAVLKLYPDGASSEYVHQAFLILTEEAKEDLAKVRPPGEVVRLRTLTRDGRILEPVAATGRDGFTLPAVTPGATVEWAYRVDQPRFNDWMVQSRNFYFQDFEYKKPFFLSRYVILIPRDLKVDIIERAMGKAEMEFQEGAQMAKVQRQVRDLPGGGQVVIYEAREVPRLEPEAGMPFREDYLPNVQVLQKRTWDDVSSRIEDRVLGLTRPSPELERAAEEAVAGAEDPLEKARKIYYHVNHLISKSSGPSRAVEVLLTRSGDRTALFKALLESAGVPSRWAFLRPQDALLPLDDGSYPSPDPFGYRYVLVEPEGRPPAWINLQVRHAPFGMLPLELSGGTAMVLQPGGGFHFTPVPAQSLEESATSLLAEMTLSGREIPDLAARVELELVARQLNSYRTKDRFRTLPDQIKRQAGTAQASRIFPGARVLSSEFPGIEEPGTPFSIRLNLEAPRLLITQGDERALLRAILQPVSLVSRHIQSPRRLHPYRFGGHLVIRDRVRISTGPDFRFERFPNSKSFSSRIGSYSLVFSFEETGKGGSERLLLERHVTILPVTLLPEEFPRIVEFCKTVDEAEEERIILRRTKAPGDS